MSTVTIIGAGGMATAIAEVSPSDAPVVKAINAGVLAAGPAEGRWLDVFLAGDDTQAKERVSAFVASLVLRPFDVGPLSMAWTLEQACMLWLGLMAHSVKHTNFSIGVSTFV